MELNIQKGKTFKNRVTANRAQVQSNYKVIITYSAGDGVENPKDLTEYLLQEKGTQRQKVFKEIQRIINPAMIYMAKEKMKDPSKINETFFKEYGYPEKRKHEYPIYFQDNGLTLKVSLILLNDMPKNEDVKNGLLELCDLKDAEKLAKVTLDNAKFFASIDAAREYREGRYYKS